MSLWCMLGIAWRVFSRRSRRALARWRAQGEFGPAGRLLRIRVLALAWQKQSERRPELRIAAESADSRLGMRAMLCTCTCAAHLSGGCSRLTVSRSPRPCRRRRTRTGRSPCTRRRGSRGPFWCLLCKRRCILDMENSVGRHHEGKGPWPVYERWARPLAHNHKGRVHTDSSHPPEFRFSTVSFRALHPW